MKDMYNIQHRQNGTTESNDELILLGDVLIHMPWIEPTAKYKHTLQCLLDMIPSTTFSDY